MSFAVVRSAVEQIGTVISRPGRGWERFLLATLRIPGSLSAYTQ